MIRALKTTSDPPATPVADRRWGRSGVPARRAGSGAGRGPPATGTAGAAGGGVSARRLRCLSFHEVAPSPPCAPRAGPPARGPPPIAPPSIPPPSIGPPSGRTDQAAGRRPAGLAAGGVWVLRRRRVKACAVAARGPPALRGGLERRGVVALPAHGHFCRPDTPTAGPGADGRARHQRQLCNDLPLIFGCPVPRARNKVNNEFIISRTARQFLP